MDDVLRKSILRVIDEGIKAGYLIQASTCVDDQPICDCVVLSNTYTDMHVIMFTATDANGNKGAISFGVNVDKYQWAVCEGFDTDDLFGNDALYESVFETLLDDDISKYLY